MCTVSGHSPPSMKAGGDPRGEGNEPTRLAPDEEEVQRDAGDSDHRLQAPAEHPGEVVGHLAHVRCEAADEVARGLLVEESHLLRENRREHALPKPAVSCSPRSPSGQGSTPIIFTRAGWRGSHRRIMRCWATTKKFQLKKSRAALQSAATKNPLTHSSTFTKPAGSWVCTICQRSERPSHPISSRESTHSLLDARTAASLAFRKSVERFEGGGTSRVAAMAVEMKCGIARLNGSRSVSDSSPAKIQHVSGAASIKSLPQLRLCVRKCQ